jgi:XapX domain-containing protein
MKPYLLSLAAGMLVGGIYALLGVKSPAPPVIALIGLLGMVLGEAGGPAVWAYLHPAAHAAETRP